MQASQGLGQIGQCSDNGPTYGIGRKVEPDSQGPHPYPLTSVPR